MFLDVGFGAEEVRDTVCRMKIKKSAGLDNLTAEHLKYGGNCIIIWLTEILNAIVDTEQIPACLKLGITIPIYKGGGKDPLNANSYRGITINSVISKVLETLILDRLEPLFVEGGVPHPNQSAYRKHVSCMDAIFATQEVINRYLMEGGKMYMCLYDLEKAFDSVEFPVLLKRLFDVGINSKTWRILRSWYTDGHSSVCLGQHVSPPFALRRGVRQGSVLSPTLIEHIIKSHTNSESSWCSLLCILPILLYGLSSTWMEYSPLSAIWSNFTSAILHPGTMRSTNCFNHAHYQEPH